MTPNWLHTLRNKSPKIKKHLLFNYTHFKLSSFHWKQKDVLKNGHVDLFHTMKVDDYEGLSSSKKVKKQNKSKIKVANKTCLPHSKAAVTKKVHCLLSMILWITQKSLSNCSNSLAFVPLASLHSHCSLLRPACHTNQAAFFLSGKSMWPVWTCWGICVRKSLPSCRIHHCVDFTCKFSLNNSKCDCTVKSC